ncbi:MAG: PHP domain-containing protein [Phycisphaerae bacterium]|nr:PHP domain-containing protein [Phycisphaerae bacterium]
MKVELHSHTMRYSGCATVTPAKLMAAAIKLRYDAVFITEHDAVWDDWELDNLRRDFPGIRIFPGVEITLPNTDHLLVLGTNDREYLKLGQPELIIARARQAGHLTVLAHPFRWEKPYSLLDAGPLPDAVEFRTLNSDARAGEQAQVAAARLRLPLVNAGDTHATDMLGHFWIETHADLVTGREIYDIVRSGLYENGMKKRK